MRHNSERGFWFLPGLVINPVSSSVVILSTAGVPYALLLPQDCSMPPEIYNATSLTAAGLWPLNFCRWVACS
jgi:hypothetical protein